MDGSWPRYVALAALALAAIAVVLHLVEPDSAPPGGAEVPAPTRDDAGTRRLRARLDALEARVAQLEEAGRVGGEVVGVPPLPPAREEPPDQQPPRPRLSPEERRRQQADQLAEWDRQVASEPVDRAWALRASQQLRTAIESSPHRADASVEILSLDCRSTQCRVELRTVGDVPLQLTGFGGWRSVTLDPASDGVTVLYVQRSDPDPAEPEGGQ